MIARPVVGLLVVGTVGYAVHQHRIRERELRGKNYVRPDQRIA